MALIQKDDVSAGNITDITLALDDAKTDEQILKDVVEYSPLVGYVNERYNRSKDARLGDEDRWLRAYRNYRGLYGPETQFTDTEKSRVFIKVTKTKVLAAYGQLVDVLFSNNKFPIGIEPTTLPEGVKDTVHVDMQDNTPEAPQPPSDLYGWVGDGNDPAPGTTTKDLLGPLKDKLQNLNVKDGPGLTPNSITFEPAMIAAKRMEKKIVDQLEESDASKHLRYTAFEMVLFGTGIIKGPFTYEKEYPKWEKGGEYKPILKKMPRVESVSVWDFYPDPDAHTINDCEYVIERHKFNRSQMRALKRRPHFRAETIEKAIADGHNYLKPWWEDALHDNNNIQSVERYEVLEFWGTIDREVADTAGLELPEEFDGLDEVEVNAWICGPHVLRLVMNPFKPQRIPYNSCPYEINPYSFFGVGVPENMEDTQTLMNGFMRMAVDNAVLSGNLVFEVDEAMLTPGQDLKVTPGKIFRRQGGAPGQALFGTKFPNTTNENLSMFEQARKLADEAVGIPSYSHGQTGVTGTTRTASGMSMLMGAAAGNIKTVTKNLDDYLLRPLGEALFAWNMQFDYDESCQGDLEVKARGTESLMQTEVKSQRLMTFLQVASNPAVQPFVKMPYVVREIAKSLDLDQDKVTNNPDEAMLAAKLAQQMGSMQAPNAGPTPSGANPMDQTGAGGGNIGVGAAPMPGEPAFSANKGPGGPAQG